MTSKLGYKEFRKQIEMISEYEKLSPEDKQKWILLACDLDIKTQVVKKYALIQYVYLFPFISMLPSPERCYNELIKVNVHCKQHFDLDGQYNDENRDKIEYVKSNFHSDFVQFWDDLNMQNEYGCKVLEDRRDVKGVTFPVTMNVYTSSTDVKFSWHVIFPEIVMQNSFHCGAIFRRLELWIINKYGEDTSKNPYYIKKEGNVDMIIDRQIYTNNRVFRLPFNTKARQMRHLKPHIISKFDVETKQFSTLDMNKTKNPDVILLESFLQYPLNYDSFDFFSCCEARSYLVYETSLVQSSDDTNSMIQTNERFEWIEPYSIGDRIITMSATRLKKMGLSHFINGHTNVNVTGKRTNSDLTISSSFLSYSNFMNSDESISLDDLMRDNHSEFNSDQSSNNVKKELKRRKNELVFEGLSQHKKDNFDVIKLKENDKKRDKKMIKSFKSVIDVAQKYITERCYPEWLNSKLDISFIDLNIERTINIESGSIHVYPKNAKRCQFKGYSDHTGNHIYFVIYTNALIGNVGFYQKCHSYHHTGPMISKIHQPFRNDLEEKLFKNLQKKFKKYIMNTMNVMFPQVNLEDGSEEMLSSWILISTLNTIYSHFIRSIATNLFSLFNQISNTEMIFKSIEKLNNQFLYYIDMNKKKVDNHMFISMIDTIIVKAICKLTNDKKRKYYIKKYAIYRSYLIIFSLSNTFSTNNFNHLVEDMFVEVLSNNGVDLQLIEGTRFDAKENHNMLHIHRLAAITEKKIVDKYKKFKVNNDVLDDVEKDDKCLVLDVFIAKMSDNISKSLDLNYNNLEY